MNFLKIILAAFLSQFYKQMYVCLSPDTFWEDYTRTFKKLCTAILQKENKVLILILRCKSNLPFCISSTLQENYFKFISLREKRKQVCISCQKSGNKLIGFCFRILQIRLFNCANFSSFLNQQTIDTLKGFSFYGLPIGKICVGEILRECQIQNEIDIDESFRELLVAKIISCLSTCFTLFVLLRLFKIKKFFYFQDYSYNLATALYLRKKKIPVFRISYTRLFGAHPTLTIISKGSRIENSLDLKSAWPNVKDFPLSPKIIRAISLHQLHRMTNKNHLIFSPINWKSYNKLKSYLDIQDSKVVTLFTSSDDEVSAIRQWAKEFSFFKNLKADDFPNQIVFIKTVAQSISRLKGDWKLIIRAHPREGGLLNKRSVQPFFQYLPLLNEFNFIKLIKPQDEVSSYNLLNITDLVATGWSSLGLESLICGAPVLRGFFNEIPAPDKDIFLNFEHCLIKNYFDGEIDYPGLLEKMIYGFRWYFLENLSEINCLDKNSKVFENLFPSSFNFNDIMAGLGPNKNCFREISDESRIKERKEIMNSLLLFFDFFSARKFLDKLTFKGLEIDKSIFQGIEKDFLNYKVENSLFGKQAARLYSLITVLKG